MALRIQVYSILFVLCSLNKISLQVGLGCCFGAGGKECFGKNPHSNNNCQKEIPPIRANKSDPCDENLKKGICCCGKYKFSGEFSPQYQHVGLEDSPEQIELGFEETEVIVKIAGISYRRVKAKNVGDTKIYHAIQLNNNGEKGSNGGQKRCVAIKEVNLKKENREQLLAEVDILNLFNKKRRRSAGEADRIIEMFGSEEVKRQDGEAVFMIAMELGVEDLRLFWGHLSEIQNLISGKQEKICIIRSLSKVLTMGKQREISDLEAEIAKVHAKIGYDSKKEGGVNVKTSRTLTKLMHEIAECLRQFNNEGIHLDIKPENFLFVKDQSYVDGAYPYHKLKLIDFGNSKIFKNIRPNKIYEIPAKNVHGTVLYMAKEELECFYQKKENETAKLTTKTDIWAVGIILHYLLYSSHPYRLVCGDRVNQSFREIEGNKEMSAKQKEEAKFRYQREHSEEIKRELYEKQLAGIKYDLKETFLSSNEVMAGRFTLIIQACLELDPKNRPTAKGILDFILGKCNFMLDGREYEEKEYGNTVMIPCDRGEPSEKRKN